LPTFAIAFSAKKHACGPGKQNAEWEQIGPAGLEDRQAFGLT